MSIRVYDEAVLDKIKRWVKDPNMRILSNDETSRLFQMQADLTGDRHLALPLIAISRDNNIELLDTSKRALTYDGSHLEATEDISKVLNAIPIKISYQIDIYTKYFAEADEYVRNFVFNLMNYPAIHITIPYNGANIEHDSSILLESTIADNSNIQERLISGQFTRLSIRFTIDDAYLFSVPFMTNWSIEYDSDVQIKEN